MQIMTSSRGVFPPAPSPWGQFKLAREDENGNENKVDLFILAVKTLLTRRGRGSGWETDTQGRWMGSWEDWAPRDLMWDSF